MLEREKQEWEQARALARDKLQREKLETGAGGGAPPAEPPAKS